MSKLVLDDELGFAPRLGPVKGLGRFKVNFDGLYEAGWRDDEIRLNKPSIAEICDGINLTDGFDETDKAIRTTDMRQSVYEYFFRWLNEHPERLPSSLISSDNS